MPSIEPLNDRVYLIWGDHSSRNYQPNIGAITTEDQTILIDAGNSPRRARQVAVELAAAGLPPVRTLIYTHHHWDHIFGAQVYHAPSIIAHEDCYAQLYPLVGKPTHSADGLRLLHGESDVSAMQSAVGDWRDFQLCLPTLTFGKTLSLLLDGVRLELIHLGGSHASDSSLVRLPQHGIAFCGDYTLNADGSLDPQRVAALLDDSTQALVDGHSPRYRAEDWRAWLRLS
ncbi:MAG: MBL fold metallo-hydrolase [Anaerolineae bacterium]|nr:MBL fold metallo-hydrolase [Anaerolineae bacterium]MDW8174011.1 MBL fold metallo-hydrolase [Anaerolineae bacterium]